ncbi:MAG: MFS transporter [Clostridia bacterium]|nr:MFS transporter [Clostridia bacterium]
MSIRTNYRHTIISGYISFITQAVINNFAPLLYITFQRDWGITLSQLAFLSTYNFLVQLCTDLISASFVKKFGVRKAIVFAHVSSAVGFVALGTLPYIMENHYAGVIIATTFYAIGGGFIEVLTSPIIEACPTDNKEANMSLLHSFYCWGQMGAVLVSTAFFYFFSTENWRYMSFIWAIIPLCNAVYLSLVPIDFATQNEAKSQGVKVLFKDKTFRLFLVMMLCAGASELSIAQWASAFAEESLGISKTAGDIAGPCFFAITMGIARVLYSKLSEKLPLEKYILFCAVLCVFGYLLTSLAPVPVLSLIGCAICGFAVGIMWPGTYSLAAKKWKNPATALFSMLALAGDSGCSSGPYLLGSVSELCNNNLKAGVLAGTVFPLIMVVAAAALIKMNKNLSEN